MVQAYETLHQADKYKNWKEYGHPDGAMAVKAVELMLPSLLTDESMKPMWLTLAFMIMIAVVLLALTWIKQRGTKLDNGLMVETKDNLRDFFYAVLQDNDGQQRMKGFSSDNLIEIYSMSIEAINQMSKLPPNVKFEDLFGRLIKNVEAGKVDFGSSSGGGDACCTPLETPEEELKGYLPKLNEVMYEFLSEDAGLPMGQAKVSDT